VAGVAPGSARSALLRLTLRGSVGKSMGGRFALRRPYRPPSIMTRPDPALSGATDRPTESLSLHRCDLQEQLAADRLGEVVP
jgi:hypothetical protein